MVLARSVCLKGRKDKGGYPSDNHILCSVYILYISDAGMILGQKGPKGAKGHQLY